MTKPKTIYFNYENIEYSQKNIQKTIQYDGYTKIMLLVDPKKPPHMQYNSNDYYASAIYVVSRPQHLEISDADGELMIENTSLTKGAPILLCIPLKKCKKGIASSIDTIIEGVPGTIDIGESDTTFHGMLYNHGTVLVRKEPKYIKTDIKKYEGFLTGDVLETAFNRSDYEPVILERFVSESSVEPLIEGFDFSTDMNSSNVGAGFGTFGKTVNDSAGSMNQGGEDFVFDFSAKTTTDVSDVKVTAAPNEIVECVPMYDNNDEVSTFVIPYGSAMSDEVSKMFMTGTFQMFYTLLIAFVILFLTPVLYKNYFAVAMRHGSSDDIEYGNKVTYSTNIYFVLFTVIMIIGVLVDASIYTKSVEEMGFAMMLIIFFMCTYLFTLMLRGAGFDPSVYGHMNTKVEFGELINLYSRFMGENFSTTYSVIIPAVAICTSIGITVGVYRQKKGDKTAMPFGGMIGLFFLGLFLILSTMGTFYNKSITMSAADVVI